MNEKIVSIKKKPHICPIMVNEEDFVAAECFREECMWWNYRYQQCCIRAMTEPRGNNKNEYNAGVESITD